MIFNRRTKKGQSTTEFLAMVFFILAVFVIFQKYIVRGLSGRWKTVGDTMGQGRIYDYHKTTECAYTQSVGWYDRICYENNCQSSCGMPESCAGCITGSCLNPYCS